VSERQCLVRQDQHYPCKRTKHNACPQKAVRQTKIYSVDEFWGHVLVVSCTVWGENCICSTITYKVHEVISSSTNNRARKWQWCARVVFVESESSKIFSSRVMTWSSRVTKTVESLRVIGLQARVNVKSHEISHFFYYIFYAMKW